jgi:hypothetical protein
VVADVGAGTGKLARLLVEEGSFVFGVEPNHDMALRLHAELGHHRNFIAVEGRAEETALPPSSQGRHSRLTPCERLLRACSPAWAEPVSRRAPVVFDKGNPLTCRLFQIRCGMALSRKPPGKRE